MLLLNETSSGKQVNVNTGWNAQGQHPAEDDQSSGSSIMPMYQEQPENFRAKRLRFSSTPFAVMEDDVYFRFCEEQLQLETNSDQYKQPTFNYTTRYSHVSDFKVNWWQDMKLGLVRCRE